MKRPPRWPSITLIALLAAITLAGQAGSTPVTDGLLLWLDATDSSTLYEDSALTKLATVGSSVGGWKDKSGNDYHATQETDASRPVYQSDVMNGKAGLHFSASDLDGMLVDPGLEVVRPFTAFVVNKYSGPAKGRTLQSTSGNWLLGLWSGRIAHYAEGWVSSDLAPVAFEGEVYVSDSVSDVAETYYTANGYDLTLNTAPTGEPKGLALNGAGWAKEYSDTDIAEVLVFDRTLSAGELSSVRNYLYDKYEATPLVPGELNDVNFGKLGLFYGGDAEDGLDLDGTFQYALDIGGNGGHQVRDALFSADSRGGVSITASNQNNPWGAASTFGDTADDAALGQVMNSIRWSTGDGAGVDTVKVTLEGIIPDAVYKLQLLFAERCCDRAFDVFVDGKEAINRLHVPSLVGTPEDPIPNSTTDAAVYTYEFVGGDSGKLEIELDGRRGFRTDPNALIHALTLEVNLELRGDFNFDGKIDEADFQVLANGMFEGNTYTQGDFNLDGRIDFTDFRALNAAAAAQPVPEPSTWALLALGGLLLASRRRRRASAAQQRNLKGPRAMRGSFLAALLVGCSLFWAASDARAQVRTQSWSNTGTGNWNEDENWTGPLGSYVPDLSSEESAAINNGGTALISSDVPAVYDLSIGNGRVALSASAGLLVDHNLTNNGTLSLAGANVDLDVTGNFAQNGRLEAIISGGTHSAIQVGGTADLGGILAVQINGPAPALGASWTLVNAGNVVDRFAGLDASLAPQLPRGAQYEVTQTDTTASLAVRNSLLLSVDRTTGNVVLENPLGAGISFDGYAIRSAGGLLRHGTWNSLAESGLGGAGWLASDSSTNTLVELNPDNPFLLAVGGKAPLGNAYAGGYVRPENEDLVLEFTTPSGEIRQGIVEYTGPANAIVLAVDPTTGEAEIRNLSPFAQVAADIDGYTVKSASGALTPATWTGLAGNAGAGAGWSKSPGNISGLAELNLNSSVLFAQGKALRIGKVFTPGALHDLVFEYAAAGSTGAPGDANGDTQVNLTDFGILKDNFGKADAGVAQGDFNGDSKVNLTDFGILKDNFGKTAVPGEADVFTGVVVYTSLPAAATPVPEPSTLCLSAIALTGLAVFKRNRKTRLCSLTRWRKMKLACIRPLALLGALGLGLFGAAPARAQDNEVAFGTLSVFTGGDPGEGLDLTGVFQYALDAGGAGGYKVGDANFTSDFGPGYSIESHHVANPWGNASSFGDTVNDNNLEQLMAAIRWSEVREPHFGVKVNLDRLAPNANYKLQLLVAEKCCNRAFDVRIDEETAVTELFAPALVGTPEVPNTGNLNAGVVFTHEFKAVGETMTILLTGENGLHPDRNAIMQGLTLELVSQVGDFNLDSKVDLTDFGILRDNMLTGDRYTQGDMDFSGLVDLRDFVKFKGVFGSQAAAAVPEPSSAVLVGIAVVCLGWAARRRGR